MRQFVYFSASAATSGNALSDGNLMHAGRMDIAIHTIIQGLFLSHDFRKDAVMHLVFYGQPDPPRHIQIQIKDETVINKKEISKIIKKALYKYSEGKKIEALPGVWIEKKSFLHLIEELSNEGNEIFILEKDGEDIRKVKIPKDCVFILGDHEGLPAKEMKRLKEVTKKVSVGNRMYFASQTTAVVNNELDYRGI